MSKGRFGIHGGQYVPETLMTAINELESAYEYYKNDEEFNKELATLFNDALALLLIATICPIAIIGQISKSK